MMLSMPVGFVVFWSVSRFGVYLMLVPIGVEVDAGMIVMIWSISGSVVVFFGEFVILLIILSIFASLFVGLLSFIFGLLLMNALGLSEVKICSGLPWEEFEARLIISTDLSLCNFFIFNWMRGELAFCFWRCFAFSSLDWARAASFERTSKSLLGL